MKKNMFIIICIIIALLSIVNIYGYINNAKVSKYIEDSSNLRRKISIIDDFRSTVVEASQFQKLYVLTKKDIYKDGFNKSISSIYNQIEDLYNKGYIDNSYREKLTYSVDEYKALSINALNQTSNYVIAPEVENQILKLNTTQLQVLHEVTIGIASESEHLETHNKDVSLSSSIQNKLIQGVSSIITILVSGFAYYFKTKFKIDDKEIEKVIDYLTKSESDHSADKPNTNPSNSNLVDFDSISTLKDRIYENEILLSNANLLYKQSIKFQSQCNKSELILKEIDIYISKLRIKLDDINDYPNLAQKIILDDIERQLYEFKILFKSLPNYNDFILDISKNMINKK